MKSAPIASNIPGTADSTTLNQSTTNITDNHSRLIILLDAENTSKSLEYIKSKLLGSNIYIALQTVKYSSSQQAQQGMTGTKTTRLSSGIGGTINGTATSRKIVRDQAENKLIGGGNTASRRRRTLLGGPPGSPQTLNTTTFYDTYLNIGKFTLDWIRSNSNSLFSENSSSNPWQTLHGPGLDLDGANFDNYQLNAYVNRYDDLNEDEEDDEDDDEIEEDSDDLNSENSSIPDQPNENTVPQPVTNGNEFEMVETCGVDMKNDSENTNNNNRRNLRNFFYEAKCAFSKYWIDYTFDSINQTQLNNDLVQFWNLYYPYIIFRPLLQLINCRVFYIRFTYLRKILFHLRRLKNRIIPMGEYDTGHGFKLFSS